MFKRIFSLTALLIALSCNCHALTINFINNSNTDLNLVDSAVYHDKLKVSFPLTIKSKSRVSITTKNTPKAFSFYGLYELKKKPFYIRADREQHRSAVNVIIIDEYNRQAERMSTTNNGTVTYTID